MNPLLMLFNIGMGPKPRSRGDEPKSFRIIATRAVKTPLTRG